MTAGSVVVPAHNEATVLARLLDSLAPLAADGTVEVIVSCNGCTDGTEAVAGRYPGVRVLSSPEPSKAAALNAADGVATRWPRLYVDADIEVSAEAVRATLDRLAAGPALAARPAYRYSDEGADWIVRAYYRARGRMPSLSASLWGAGVYGLSQRGHERIGAFPDLTVDDLFVDRQFLRHEIEIVPTVPVVVRTPRNVRALLPTLSRVLRGREQVIAADRSADTTRQTMGALARSVRGPRSLFDAAVYAAVALAARRQAADSGANGPRWERDDSSR